MSAVELSLEISDEERPFDWPLFGLQDDIRPALARARAQSESAVLATLYGVEGAAPRDVGAQMVFTGDQVVGFLSGGCIEADLAIHAQQVMVSWKPAQVTYGEGGPVDVRLPCGSRISILLEPLASDDAAVTRLLRCALERTPALWLTDGAERLCVAPGELSEAPHRLAGAAATRMDQIGQVCGYAEAPFALFRAFAPRRRLLAIGSDPIAFAVVKLAAQMGMETTLVRPRGPETCPFRDIRYDRAEVDVAIARARPDPWTAIAILTHEREQEQAALVSALATSAGYVGVLGSRRRTSERIARLQASRIEEADIRRVHSPIGLPIGSKAPWEIAVSIIAEIVRDLDAAQG